MANNLKDLTGTTPMAALRKAWQRDWDRLVLGAEISGGVIRHIYDDCPDGYDGQLFERMCRKDYENVADFYCLEPLETSGVV